MSFPVGNSTSFVGYLHLADWDVFEFVAPNNTTLTLESYSNSDTYVHMYNVNWVQLAFDDDSGVDYNFLLRYAVLAGRKYYIAVRGYSSTVVGAYTMGLTYPDPSLPFDDVGNSLGTRYSLGTLTITGLIFHSRINYVGDSDFFGFIHMGALDTFLNVTATTSVQLTLFDALSATQIGSFTGTLLNILIPTSTTSGAFSISMPGGIVGNYTLALLPQVTDDYGDSISQATSVLIPTDRSMILSGMINYAGDSDYISFISPNTSRLVVTATGNIDTYGYLYGPTRTLIMQNDDTVGLNFVVTTTVQAGIRYYVRVHHYSATGTGAYGLFFEFSALPVTTTTRSNSGQTTTSFRTTRSSSVLSTTFPSAESTVTYVSYTLSTPTSIMSRTSVMSTLTSTSDELTMSSIEISLATISPTQTSNVDTSTIPSTLTSSSASSSLDLILISTTDTINAWETSRGISSSVSLSSHVTSYSLNDFGLSSFGKTTTSETPAFTSSYEILHTSTSIIWPTLSMDTLTDPSSSLVMLSTPGSMYLPSTDSLTNVMDTISTTDIATKSLDDVSISTNQMHMASTYLDVASTTSSLLLKPTEITGTNAPTSFMIPPTMSDYIHSTVFNSVAPQTQVTWSSSIDPDFSVLSASETVSLVTAPTGVFSTIISSLTTYFQEPTSTPVTFQFEETSTVMATERRGVHSTAITFESELTYTVATNIYDASSSTLRTDASAPMTPTPALKSSTIPPPSVLPLTQDTESSVGNPSLSTLRTRQTYVSFKETTTEFSDSIPATSTSTTRPPPNSSTQESGNFWSVAVPIMAASGAVVLTAGAITTSVIRRNSIRMRRIHNKFPSSVATEFGQKLGKDDFQVESFFVQEQISPRATLPGASR